MHNKQRQRLQLDSPPDNRRSYLDMKQPLGPSTQSVHAGAQHRDGSHALPQPIVATATYRFDSSADLQAFMAGEGPSREEYGRYGNPTVSALEARVAALEDPSGGAECVAFSSGMAAITTTLLALLKQGAHVIIFRDGYRRTRQFVARTLANFGIAHTAVETGDLEAVAKAILPTTRMIVIESPTNPYLHVTDLVELARLAKAHRIRTVVDATFATPIHVRPLAHGIDMVIHSATKYLAGHHDVLAGVVTAAPQFASLVRDLRGVLGGVLDPNAGFLVARGLKTLGLRMERVSNSSQTLATRLQQHADVRAVHYPGLESHPSHRVASEQMTGGFGGVVSFSVKTRASESTLAAGSRVVDRLKLAAIAPSLGGVDSLVEQPSLMSYSELSAEDRLAIGIEDDLIRLAVGIEDVEDLWRDLDQALSDTSS